MLAKKLCNAQSRIKVWLVSKKNKTGLFSAFISFVYWTLTNEYINVTVEFIVPLLAGFYYKIGNKVNWGFIFWFTVLYTIYLLLKCMAQNYKHQKFIDFSIIEHTFGRIVAILRLLREKIYDNVLNIQNGHQPVATDGLFHKACECVTEELYDNLCTVNGTDKFKVTIFQKFEKPESHEQYCNLVAYRNAGSDVPECLRQDFPLNKPHIHNSKKCFFVRIFEKHPKERPIILRNKSEVLDKFREAEEPLRIEQYIGYPVSIGNNEVGFLIQMCAYEKMGFGNELELQSFIKNALIPCVQVLKIMYEEERIQCLLAERG